MVQATTHVSLRPNCGPGCVLTPADTMVPRLRAGQDILRLQSWLFRTRWKAQSNPAARLSSVVVLTQRVVRQRLDYMTLAHLAVIAEVSYPGQFALQPLQLLNAISYGHKVRCSDAMSLRARLFRLMTQFDQLPNCFNGQPKISRVFDERQALKFA